MVFTPSLCPHCYTTLITDSPTQKMSAEPSAAPAPETTEVTNDSNPAPVENQAAEDGTNPTVAEDKAEEKAEEKPEEKTEEKAEDKVEEKAEENAEEKAEEPKEDEQVKEDAKEDKEASPAKPPSSKAKKAGRPATKPRSSVGPASKKAGAASTSNGDKSFKIGDTVLARLKGYPAWRESGLPFSCSCFPRSLKQADMASFP